MLLSPHGEVHAEIPGRLRHAANDRRDLPAVGDRVLFRPLPGEDRGVIEEVLPRSSVFSRKVAGDRTDEQVVAANIDVLFLVMALNEDLNLRRIERYLTLAWESGAVPVILLTKTDLSPDLARALDEVGAVAPGVEIIPVCAPSGEGLDEVRSHLLPDRTGALLGSSGVGKSTLLNHLIGREVLKVKEIRDDGKGRHTTTHRELIYLPGGGALIDTPGMRELQLWSADDGLDSAFEDIARLADDCRFTDCSHEKEPGCAVKDAVASGALARARLDSFRKLQNELAYLERKQSKRLQNLEARRIRKLNEHARRRSQAKQRHGY